MSATSGELAPEQAKAAVQSAMAASSIERGMASTENFRIQGPSARITMSGQVDLARENQRLHVRIVQSLSDSVSIAGALIGGPVAGVATILAQKILKDPLGQIFAYEYDVAGGRLDWSGELEPVLGYQFADLNGPVERWASFIHPDDYPDAGAPSE